MKIRIYLHTGVWGPTLALIKGFYVKHNKCPIKSLYVVFVTTFELVWQNTLRHFHGISYKIDYGRTDDQAKYIFAYSSLI